MFPKAQARNELDDGQILQIASVPPPTTYTTAPYGHNIIE